MTEEEIEKVLELSANVIEALDDVFKNGALAFQIALTSHLIEKAESGDEEAFRLAKIIIDFPIPARIPENVT